MTSWGAKIARHGVLMAVGSEESLVALAHKASCVHLAPSAETEPDEPVNTEEGARMDWI